MTRIWTLGVTGGIACGKTSATDILSRLGCLVADADTESRALTMPGGGAIPAIRREFGSAFIRADGGLDRDAMRRRAFSDPEARRKLEAIIHPKVQEAILRKLREPPEGAPYAVVSVPLLPSILRMRPLLGRILVIDLPEAVQEERLMARSGLGREEARAIMASQSGRAERLSAADDVIMNTGSPEDLERAVLQLDRLYRRLAAGKDQKK